ncbi:MAG: DUF1080 domain-containing protein, partial [Planctomicrobium sp.]|nr:DUF1080 domain-containing protein [Planctomicrobium sp.]
MQKTFLWIAVLASLSLNPLLAVEPNNLSQAEKMAGWELLFDGKSAENFRNYKKDDISDGWVIEDGNLIR